MEHQAHHHSAPALHTVTDPVCGMRVDPSPAAHSTEFDGRAFHFCSAGCLEKFRADPDRYAAVPEPDHEHDHAHDHEGPGAGATAESARSDQRSPGGDVVEYTCPMHPEIRRPGPGPCPI